MLTLEKLNNIATKKNFKVTRSEEKTKIWSEVDQEFEMVDTVLLEPEFGIIIVFHLIDDYCYYKHTINNLKGTTRRASVMTRKILFK
jgi:hypothetical protein